MIIEELKSEIKKARQEIETDEVKKIRENAETLREILECQELLEKLEGVKQKTEKGKQKYEQLKQKNEQLRQKFEEKEMTPDECYKELAALLPPSESSLPLSQTPLSSRNRGDETFEFKILAELNGRRPTSERNSDSRY